MKKSFGTIPNISMRMLGAYFVLLILTGITLQPAQAQSTLAQDAFAYCENFGIADTSSCTMFIAYDLNAECIKAHDLTPDECERFIRSQYLADLCTANNLPPEAVCYDALYQKYKNEIYCGVLAAPDCGSIVKERMLGQVVARQEQRSAFMRSFDAAIGNFARVDEILKVITDNGMSRETVPIETDGSRTVMIRRSDRTIDVSNKVLPEFNEPYLILMDDEGDGIPNDLETYYGTNPKNSDTDNDGFGDRAEIISGYDPGKPNGEKTNRALSPGEEAILSGVPIEQPMIKGNENKNFSITQIQRNATNSNTLTGTAEKNSLVFVYLYSPMPLLLITHTNETGAWTYKLDGTLTEGKHIAYVATTNNEGKIMDKSAPFAFIVQNGNALSAKDFFKKETAVTIPSNNPTSASAAPSYIIYVTGAAVIVVLLILIIFIFVKKRKKSP